jgi:hypothetical protein
MSHHQFSLISKRHNVGITYISTSIKCIWYWKNLQYTAQTLPGGEVIHVCPIHAVELMGHCIFEGPVSFLPVVVISFPTKEIAHPIELRHHRRGWIVGEIRIFFKELMKVNLRALPLVPQSVLRGTTLVTF